MSSSTRLDGVKASAGSKVMICGGYLVLHQENSGIVLGVNARLHTGIYGLKSDSYHIKPKHFNNISTYPILINSPQKSDKPLLLYLSIQKDDINSNNNDNNNTLHCPYTIEITGDCHLNPYVSKTLHYTFIVLLSLLPYDYIISYLNYGLIIDIRGDRPFYSSQPPVYSKMITPTGNNNNDNIHLEPVYIDDQRDYTSKTGLGSSAALVSSLTYAIFSYFKLVNTENSTPIDTTATTTTTTTTTTSTTTHPPLVLSSSIIQLSNIKSYIYRIAQISHCIAQGKVGSGFDIAASFYGTHQYNRFSQSLVLSLINNPLESTSLSSTASLSSSSSLSQTATHNTISLYDDIDVIHPYSTSSTSQILLDCIISLWDDRIEPFRLPPRVQLFVGDVQGGSETPSMVKKIEAWRIANQQQIMTNQSSDNNNTTITTTTTTINPPLWCELAQQNMKILTHLKDLNLYYIQNNTLYNNIIDILYKLPSSQWDINMIHKPDTIIFNNNDDGILYNNIINTFYMLSSSFQHLRSLLRQLSLEADVPVEPPTQTMLLDSISSVPGVILAGVPGAGGYDAISVLHLDAEIQSSSLSQCNDNMHGPVYHSIISIPDVISLGVNIDNIGGISSKYVMKDFNTILQ